MKLKHLLMILIILGLSAGCSLGAPKTTPQPPTSLPLTQTVALPVLVFPDTVTPSATVTLTPTITLTVEPSQTPTPKPFTPFYISSEVDHLNVRVNPGRLFNTFENVKQGTRFLVLGQSPGGEWVYVENMAQKRGWIFLELASSKTQIKDAPIISPTKVQLVKGQLKDSKGTPISGIQFALVKGSGNNAPRNDAVTDENGEFFAFMPEDASGEWTISYTAYSCTSNTVDANCKCKEGLCGKPDPESLVIKLPHPETLSFTWK
jgi:hypothetical protein